MLRSLHVPFDSAPGPGGRVTRIAHANFHVVNINRIVPRARKTGLGIDIVQPLAPASDVGQVLADPVTIDVRVRALTSPWRRRIHFLLGQP
jgi:hypothetical protein